MICKKPIEHEIEELIKLFFDIIKDCPLCCKHKNLKDDNYNCLDCGFDIDFGQGGG